MEYKVIPLKDGTNYMLGIPNMASEPPMSFRDEVILEQQQTIEKLKCCGNWISVEDRLPELNQLCLVYTSWNGKPHGYDISRYYKMSNCGLDRFTRDLNSQDIRVTHWQPLPEPPNK